MCPFLYNYLKILFFRKEKKEKKKKLKNSK